MTCEGCKKTILRALQHTGDIFNLEADLSGKTVSFYCQSPPIKMGGLIAKIIMSRKIH